MHSLVVGLGFGFIVAMQVGPMSLFLVRSTLRSGWLVGAAIGAGIACADALYAACGAAGAAPLLTIEPLRLLLGVLGAAVLLVLGARTLYNAFRIRHGGDVGEDVASPGRAYLTSLAATASNPLTIASWAAVFAAASATDSAGTAARAIALVTGVGLGSLAWGLLLAAGTALARRAVGERANRIADAIAGLGMLGFGGALAVGALRER